MQVGGEEQAIRDGWIEVLEGMVGRDLLKENTFKIAYRCKRLRGEYQPLLVVQLRNYSPVLMSMSKKWQ